MITEVMVKEYENRIYKINNGQSLTVGEWDRQNLFHDYDSFPIGNAIAAMCLAAADTKYTGIMFIDFGFDSQREMDKVHFVQFENGEPKFMDLMYWENVWYPGLDYLKCKCVLV